MSTTPTNAVVPAPAPDLFMAMCTSLGEAIDADPRAVASVIQATVMQKATKAETQAFMLVCTQYRLNPLTKEIYAFPAKGGIQPVVSIDGWINLANRHPAMDGVQCVDVFDADGKLSAVTCRVQRKDRAHPVEITEHLRECYMPTDPWKKYPHRMLRHKAMIQAFRVAFGFAGIVDPDEAERMAPREAEVVVGAPRTLAQIAQSGAALDFEEPQLVVDEPQPEATPAPKKRGSVMTPAEMEAALANTPPKSGVMFDEREPDPG